ncbi:MAG: amidohydrolase [Bacteroidota bacterium]
MTKIFLPCFLASFCILFFTAGCQSTSTKVKKVDLILHGGTIYTLDTLQPTVEAVAVKDDEIVFAGTLTEAKRMAGEETTLYDLKGGTLTPGFIESHAHLMGLGRFKLQLDLRTTRSYTEMVQLVEEAIKTLPEGQWVEGFGWHQSKWDSLPTDVVRGFPVHDALSSISPDHPVFLEHASGHGAMANKNAMEIAGLFGDVTLEAGGEVIQKPGGGPTGMLIERASELVSRHIPSPSPEKEQQAIQAAFQDALSHGITTFCDAGATTKDLELMQSIRASDELPLRVWVMLSGDDTALVNRWLIKGPQQDDWLTIRAIKLYADGALGSRGAWLLKPYDDMPGQTGHALMPIEDIGEVARRGLEHGFQVCVHAIGDRANREVLNQFEQALSAFHPKTDHRFRIEHAQHLTEVDIPRFAELGIIPSMQAIHMASDRPWAINRLGFKRIQEGAYVWQKLLAAGSPVLNGTDAPIEPINPVPCFYASVTRKTLAGTPDGGYEPSQRMTREQALKSYTLDAAYGAFLDHQRGSIEVGKKADFTWFDQDLLMVPESDMLKTQVLGTMVGGEWKYRRSEDLEN